MGFRCRQDKNQIRNSSRESFFRANGIGHQGAQTNTAQIRQTIVNVFRVGHLWNGFWADKCANFDAPEPQREMAIRDSERVNVHPLTQRLEDVGVVTRGDL